MPAHPSICPQTRLLPMQSHLPRHTDPLEGPQAWPTASHDSHSYTALPLASPQSLHRCLLTSQHPSQKTPPPRYPSCPLLQPPHSGTFCGAVPAGHQLLSQLSGSPGPSGLGAPLCSQGLGEGHPGTMARAGLQINSYSLSGQANQHLATVSAGEPSVPWAQGWSSGALTGGQHQRDG